MIGRLLKRFFPPAPTCDRSTPYCTVDHAKWDAELGMKATPCNPLWQLEMLHES